jgi:hypothetical protein
LEKADSETFIWQGEKKKKKIINNFQKSIKKLISYYKIIFILIFYREKNTGMIVALKVISKKMLIESRMEK